MSIKGAIAGTHPGIPVIERLDLTVNGSGTPIFVEATQDKFTFIVRIIWKLQFTTNSMEWTKFDDSTALANGIQVIYHSEDLLPIPVKNNADFHDYGYDVSLQADGATTKGNVLSSRWTFSKWVPNGLGMWNAENFGILVSDDLRIVTRTAMTEFVAVVEGWKQHP